MRYEVLKNEKRFFEVENETIGGLCFSFLTEVAALKPVGLSSCRINVYLKQDGKKTTQLLPSMTFYDLHQIQFCNNEFLSQKTFEIKRSFAFGADYFQFKYMFGTPLNLKNGQSLWVEIENNGSGSATTFTIATETVPVIGVQNFIPVVERLDLDSLRTEQDLNLGDNLTSAVYIANASEGIGNVSSIDIKSDKLVAEISGHGVYSQLQETTEPITDYENSSIYLLNSHLPLNGTKMRITLKEAYPDRKIYLVRSVVTPEIANNYMLKTQEHSEENMQHIKTTSCECNH